MNRDFLNGLSSTPAAYRSAARRLRGEPAPDLKPLHVTVAASFTASPLEDYLIVEGARRGLHPHLSFTPYGQFEIQCSTPESALFAGRPDVVVVAARLEDLVPALWNDYEALAESERRRLVDQACARIEQMVSGIQHACTASVAVFNFAEPRRASWGIRPSPLGLIAYANARLEKMCAARSGVYVFDFARLVLEMGLRQVCDARLEYLSRMPFSVAAQIELARRLARWIGALAEPPFKCLVLDLDNTLWGGVLGEAGPGGIALGEDYPGSVFRDFQWAVRGLRSRGFLLAIASKNNLAEVREVFEHHPDMVLRWDDFAAAEIHWEDKAASLRRIADRLRLGIHSLAFYDDSPVERDWIRSRIPEVKVIDVPDALLERVAALDACAAFDQITISDEDRLRPALYAGERQREQAQSESPSFEEFLSRLEIRVTAGMVDAATLPRVAQLINKTNQFNLTSRRYTEAELEGLRKRGAMGCWLRVRDRFGDYGLVGAAFVLPAGGRDWRIDNFVLSCRILGRQVETALLAVVAGQVADAGAERLIGEYIPSAKNAPARDFFASQGFQPEGECWCWNFRRGPIQAPAFISIEMPAAEGAPVE